MDEYDKALLNNITILRLLPIATREKLLDKFTIKKFKFGEIIVREGEPADVFYLLTAGKARVLTTTNDGAEIPLNILQAGDCFGEMGLLSSGVRTKTIRASSDATAMCLNGDDFNKIISQNREVSKYIHLLAKYRNLENFLREFTSLGKVPSDLLQSILKSLEIVEVKAGNIIIKEGSDPGPMYIIEKGRCRVIRSITSGGNRTAYLRQGEFFGELSLFQNARRVATVEAVSDCTLLAFSPDMFKAMLKDFPILKNIVEKRIALYKAGKESNRMPLDFAQIIASYQQDELPANEDNKIFQNTSYPSVFDNSLLLNPSHVQRKQIKKIKRPTRFPFIRQIDESDCGAAALGMVCHYFGRRFTLAHIREISGTSVDGTTLKDLCRAAVELGLEARAVKLSKRNLETVSNPAIVHWQHNHWVVLIRKKKQYFQIADPADRISWIHRTIFEKNWSGYAILFDDSGECRVLVPEIKGFIPWILPELKSFTWPISKTFFVATVACVLQLLFPILTQIIVDNVIIAKNPENLNLFVTSLGVVLVITLLLTIFQQRVLSYISTRLDGIVSKIIITKLLALPLSYFTKRSPDDIQRRLEGARDVKHFLVYRVINSIIAFVQLFAFVILMSFYNVKMTLIFFILFPIYLGLMFFSAKVLKSVFDDLQISEARYRTLQKDIVKGIQVVKAAGCEALFKKKILSEYSILAKSQSHSNFNIFCYEGTIQALGLLSTIIFIWIGVRLVLINQLTIGSFIAFQMLIAMSYSPILTLLNIWQELQRSSVLINRLNDIIVCAPEKNQFHDNKTVTTLQGRIECRNLSFSYGGVGSPKILNNISLTAVPGQLIAIVGKSGAGKSSLAKCIAGLLEPTHGVILYDDITLNSLNASTLRRFIGLVTQDDYLFSGSVIENIALGDPRPNMEKVIWAAKSANAHKFILELPNEYQTVINEVELHLSQGQKQAIAIARVLYRDPPVLILDEATSAMDLESEGMIWSNLERLRPGRLVIIVTHRLDTIRHADTIFVMEKGYIVEQGNHENLMTRRGLYHQLFTTTYA